MSALVPAGIQLRPHTSASPVSPEFSELHLAQDQRQRHRRSRDQHQRPEHIDVGQYAACVCDLLADPGNRLPLRVRRTAVRRGEILASPVRSVS